MSKFFVLILSLFVWTTTTWAAGPGDGPIVPWPTTSLLESAEKSAMLGSWVGYHNNAVWFIDVLKDPATECVYELKIYSHALRNHWGYGRIKFDTRAFWGTVYMDESHSSAVYIFRELDGTPTMRIGKNNRWQDIHLYRSPSTHD